MLYPGLVEYLLICLMRLRKEFFQRTKCMCNKVFFQCMVELLLVQQFFDVRW